MQTRKLNIGDLVAYETVKSEYCLGMIVGFDEGFTQYTIEWVQGPKSYATWMTTQNYRNNYLEYRNKEK